MTTPPFPDWVRAASDALLTEPADIARRADRFSRKVRIRNVLEFAAGAIVLVPLSVFAIGAAMIGEWAFALALALMAAGVIAVLANLRARAGDAGPLPEEPCLDHLRRQYRRQYAALHSVPTWYVAPLVPGLALLYASVTWKSAQTLGWARALEGVAVPVLATIAFGIGVIALNRWAARALKRKLDALEALA